MRKNFDEALAAVLIHEGGFVDHPRDPGGATNKGITHRTYDAWRRMQGLPTRSVRYITDDEVAAIYKRQYWDEVKGDLLPSGVDYAVFDFAVNSGPARAAKFLQRIVGVVADGIIGQQTLAAVSGALPRHVVIELCAARLAWLKRLPHWSDFGRGWERRVNEVKAKAMRLAGLNPSVVEGREASKAAQGKAPDPEPPSNTIPAIIGGGGATAGFGAILTGAAGLHPVVQGILIVGVLGLAAAAFMMWRNAERSRDLA